MDMTWENGFTISVSAENGSVLISANREGLLSLAAQLSALANENCATHMHYDEHNSLEDGSAELIVERTD